jgi:hypothetical protein
VLPVQLAVWDDVQALQVLLAQVQALQDIVGPVPTQIQKFQRLLQSSWTLWCCMSVESFAAWNPLR